MLHSGVLHHSSRARPAHHAAGAAGSSLEGGLAAHRGELLGVEHHLLLLLLLLLLRLLLAARSAGRALARLLLHVDVLLLMLGWGLVVELWKSGSLGVGEAIAAGRVHGHAYVLYSRRSDRALSCVGRAGGLATHGDRGQVGGGPRARRGGSLSRLLPEGGALGAVVRSSE